MAAYISFTLHSHTIDQTMFSLGGKSVSYIFGSWVVSSGACIRFTMSGTSLGQNYKFRHHFDQAWRVVKNELLIAKNMYVWLKKREFHKIVVADVNNEQFIFQFFYLGLTFYIPFCQEKNSVPLSPCSSLMPPQEKGPRREAMMEGVRGSNGAPNPLHHCWR